MSGISGLHGYQIRCNGYNQYICNYCDLRYCSRSCFQKCGIQKHICNFNGSGIRNVCRKYTGK